MQTKNQKSLSRAFDTATAQRLNKADKVVLPIVIGQLFASLDTFLGHDKNAAAPIDCLTVRAARMIGIAGRIVAWAAIDVPLGINIEHIAVITLITDTRRDALTDVFNDRRPLLEGYQSKKPQPSTPALGDDRRFLLYSLSHKELLF